MSRPTVDGEYDPMTAAANRAAAERRAREARERLRLQREAEARRAREAAAKKRAEAARLAEIKKKQAETAAKLERVRLSAEKRAKAAAQRAQERAAKKAQEQAAQRAAAQKAAQKAAPKPKIPKPTTPKVGAGARDMKAGRAMGGPAGVDPSVRNEIVLENFLDGWAATNDKLYTKGNFLTPIEKAKVLKEVRENPILGYNLMTGVKNEKPPKTIDEALNRLKYVVSEIALGGAREVTLPFSLGAGQPRRVDDAILQVTGGLLTPSPSDVLVSNAVGALVRAGKKGNRILQKVMNGIPLGTDEAKQFEKLMGQYGVSTSDLRKAGTKLGKLSQSEWDEFIKKYGEYYNYRKKFPNIYSAGAGYEPSALTEFADVMDDLGYDLDEYIDYLKTYKLGPTLNPATITAFTLGLKPPTPDLKAFEKIESDLEKYRESLKQKLKEAQEEAVITGPATRTGPKQPDPILPGFTPPPEVVKEKEDEKLLPGFTPPPVKVKPDQPDPTKPGVTPKPDEEGEEDDDEGGGGAVTPVLIQKEKTTTIQEQEEEEDQEEDQEEEKIPISLTPPFIKKDKDDPGSRPNVFNALIGGMKEPYRVVFDYPKGPSETFIVTARSFPQALSQAQQKRRIKRWAPSEVDIAKTRTPTKK